MSRSIRYSIMIALSLALVAEGDPVAARGFGGFHGGGLGGGGFRGGGGFGGGGFGGFHGGGGFGGPSFAGGARMGGFGGGQFGGRTGGMNPGFRGAGGGDLGGLGSSLGAGAGSGRLDSLEGRMSGGGGPLAGRLSGLDGGLTGRGDGGRLDALTGKTPSRDQLGQFLGLPSDNGLHHLSGETQSRMSQAVDKARAGDGPFGGNLSGETQKPASRLYDQVKDGDGPRRDNLPGETQSAGSRLYDKVRDGDAPFRSFIPGETQKPLSRLYDSVRAGDHPLGPMSPWRNHNRAVVIRRNFNNYAIFTPAWFASYPAAWYPAVWYFGDPWVWAPWPTLSEYCGYSSQPMYYDYGNNVVYQDNSVVVNGSSVGTPAEYSQQASQIAAQGSDADPADSEKWLSLGVFAVSQGDQQDGNMVMQLAVDKQGIIRGNYDNTATKDTQVIHGAVDKTTQRAAWTIGSHQDIVLDTGIYNLTKDETPVLVHFKDGQTKQWLMVRIKGKSDGEADADDARQP